MIPRFIMLNVILYKFKLIKVKVIFRVYILLNFSVFQLDWLKVSSHIVFALFIISSSLSIVHVYYTENSMSIFRM